MNDYIRRAFKSLEDLQVVIEPVKSTLREDLEVDIKEEPETIRDLFEDEKSFIVVYDFEDDGINYSVFFEALNEDGESCDLLFDAFDINAIDEILVEVLDGDREFLGSLTEDNDFTLDTALTEVIGKAKAFLNGEETKEVTEIEEVPAEGEEVEVNEREFIAGEPEVENEELLVEESVKLYSEDEIFDAVDGSLKASGDSTAINIDGKVFVCDLDKVPENGVPADGNFEFTGCEVSANDIGTLDDGTLYMADCEPEKHYVVKNGRIVSEELTEKCEGQECKEECEHCDEEKHVCEKCGKEICECDKSLTESQKFDLYDEEQVEEAEEDIEELKNATTNDEVMQIVDVSAESTDELRDSYIGGMVLQCPVCKATMFKDMDQLVKEEDGDLYNVDEECPHCGSKGGFDLIGQLAKPDVNPFGEEPAPEAEAPIEEPVASEEEEVTIEAEPLPELPAREEGRSELVASLNTRKTGDVILESLDENKFDKLVIKYLKETYTNIKNYRTTDAAVDDTNNKLIIEGLITFNSGKEKKTTFIFEAKEMTNKNQLKLVGMNETFASGKAFTLLAGTDNGKLLSESLAYRYTIDDKKVKGKAQAFQKR